MKIGIVDYGIGNLGSILNAFNYFDHEVVLIDKPKDLRKTDLIVLSGVGNFATVAVKLREKSFWEELNELVLAKHKAIIGVCLGMQIMATAGYEDGVNEGFNWIEGEVKKIISTNVRIPHIGWDEVQVIKPELFKDMKYRSFYFMHSYHFMPKHERDIAGVTDYGDMKIVSAIWRDNIIGVQFHPEKSQGDGLKLINNALEIFTQ